MKKTALGTKILSTFLIFGGTVDILLYAEKDREEFGSNTFMATGTNTVTLFMRRRSNYDCKSINIAVQDAILHKKDSTINKIVNPISKYISHVWQGIVYSDYVSLLEAKPNPINLFTENSFSEDW